MVSTSILKPESCVPATWAVVLNSGWEHRKGLARWSRLGWKSPVSAPAAVPSSTRAFLLHV
eukprot:3488269-Amphidinium_carterae.1